MAGRFAAVRVPRRVASSQLSDGWCRAIIRRMDADPYMDERLGEATVPLIAHSAVQSVGP